MLDLTLRVLAATLWRLENDMDVTPRVSDTQRAEIGEVIVVADLVRLVFSGTAAVLRCIANFAILWYGFDLLRPSWGDYKMRYMKHLFRLLLLAWIIGDLLQACVPDSTQDLVGKRKLSTHMFLHQVVMCAAGCANLLLLVVLSYDRQSGGAAVKAGFLTLFLMLWSLVYYTIHLIKGEKGISTPMGWALVVEISFLMFNVGQALPPTIVATRGKLESPMWPQVVRLGKVFDGEDASARSDWTPPITSNDSQIDHRVQKTEPSIADIGKECSNDIPAELAEAMKCAACTHVLRPGAKFCARCGTSRPKPQNTPAQEQPEVQPVLPTPARRNIYEP